MTDKNEASLRTLYVALVTLTLLLLAAGTAMGWLIHRNSHVCPETRQIGQTAALRVSVKIDDWKKVKKFKKHRSNKPKHS